VPLTLIVIEPVNTQLMREPDLLADGEAAALLTSWARLHALRTVLGLAGFVVAAAAAVSN
jgi:hypothetical protein